MSCVSWKKRKSGKVPEDDGDGGAGAPTPQNDVGQALDQDGTD